MFCFCFFFQAEDGIRDRSPSRGLGDVYKRQGKTLGKVAEIMELPANDVWVVKAKGQDDIFLPYIENVVTEIDLDAGVALSLIHI